jgi:hypothetical protein
VSSCEISVADAADAAFQLGDDESYSLLIHSDATCKLSAKTVFGALRGMESLSQLIEYSSFTDSYELRMAPWNITDKPAFPQRGVMIDTARHWLSVPTILRQIDALSYNRMNTLHWHAVDGDSFPVASTSFPKLAELGSYSSSVLGPRSSPINTVGVYTVADQTAIVEYARMRGVRVLIEFDVPGKINLQVPVTLPPPFECSKCTMHPVMKRSHKCLCFTGHSSAWALALPELFIKCNPGEIKRIRFLCRDFTSFASPLLSRFSSPLTLLVSSHASRLLSFEVLTVILMAAPG